MSIDNIKLKETIKDNLETSGFSFTGMPKHIVYEQDSKGIAKINEDNVPIIKEKYNEPAMSLMMGSIADAVVSNIKDYGILDDLSDVTIKNPTNKSALVYNNSSKMWENNELKLIDGDIYDVSINGLMEGNLLRFINGKWRNIPLASLSISLSRLITGDGTGFWSRNVGTGSLYPRVLTDNICIGTTSSTSCLTVNWTAGGVNKVIDVTDSVNGAVAYINNYGDYYTTYGSINAVFTGAFTTDVAGFGTVSNHDMVVFTKSLERMWILKGGSVGIGRTPNVANTLEIAGKVRIGDTGANTYSFEIVKNSLSAINEVRVENTNGAVGAGALVVTQGESAYCQIFSVSDAYYLEELRGKGGLSSNKILALFGADDEIQFYTGGYTAEHKKMTLTSAGFLGIGWSPDSSWDSDYRVLSLGISGDNPYKHSIYTNITGLNLGFVNGGVYYDSSNDRWEHYTNFSTPSQLELGAGGVFINLADGSTTSAGSEVFFNNHFMVDRFSIRGYRYDNNASPLSIIFEKRKLSSGVIQAGVNADVLCEIQFRGYNDDGLPEVIVYSKLIGKIISADDGVENGNMEFHTVSAGVSTNTFELNSGLIYANPLKITESHPSNYAEVYVNTDTGRIYSLTPA